MLSSFQCTLFALLFGFVESFENAEGGSYRVLFQGMHASDSHVASSMPFALRFLQSGHDVEFLETHIKPTSFNYPPGINHTYIRLPDDGAYSDVLSAIWTGYSGSYVFASVYLIGEVAAIDVLHNHKEQMLPYLTDSHDVLIIDEIFSTLGYGLALRKNNEGRPFIVLSSCASPQFMSYHLALGNNYITRPGYFQLPGKRFSFTSFTSRLENFLESLNDHILVHGALMNKGQGGARELGLPGLNLADVAKQSSFYLYDDLNMFLFPQPVGTETLHVGFHCPKFKTLTGEYLEHVNHPNSKGTILVAFGTNVHWGFAPSKTISTFVDALKKLTDYRIVWTYNGDPSHVASIGSHVKITDWAPQKELLAHPKTVVFVSHGGQKSVKDTVCAGVPVVFMPILAEQTLNAEMCRQAGFAEILVKTELTADGFEKSLRLVIENRRYKEAMLRFQGFFHDRPIPSLDLANWALQRAAKLKNRSPTFKRKGMEQTFVQRFYLEYLIPIAIVLVVLCK